MTPMRHALSIVAATAVAVGLAVGIHSFGAHDSSGFLTVILGYPGIAVISATELENRDAEGPIHRCQLALLYRCVRGNSASEAKT
jgi:hypothetical protein